ncbi:MAG: FecR domain-containing protein [Spirochaetes bacterium]|nr:FecR domain-containing protein [Spirochaetota bacterium]
MSAIVCFIAAGCVKGNKEPSPITVVSVIGRATLNAPGNDLLINAVIRPGDTIITREKSMAYLRISENSGVKIYENSRFTLTENLLADGGGTDSLYAIDRGKTLFMIEKLSKNSSLKVATPTAVASVRGTSFIVDVSEDKESGATTDVKVIAGEVTVTSKEKPDNGSIVGVGEMVIVAGDGSIEKKKEIPEKKLRELRREAEDLDKTIIKKADAITINAQQVVVSSDKVPVLKSEEEIKKYYHKLEQVNLDDGTTLVGAVIYQDASIVKIHTASGLIKVPTSSIKNIILR